MRDHFHINRWLDALGYSQASHGIRWARDTVPHEHIYHGELKELLNPDGLVRAHAVFEVDGVPAVAFFDQRLQLSSEDLDRVRQKIWNQNLVSLILVIDDETLHAYAPSKSVRTGESLTFGQAVESGRFSVAELASSDIQRRIPKWFSPEERVDQQLLRNLALAVKTIEGTGLNRAAAQGLLGQVLFISYLEHRQVVSEAYRADRNVASLHKLVSAHDVEGIEKLINRLRKDFNGDFLSLDHVESDWWTKLNTEGLSVLLQFLDRVDLDTGQQAFWNYDFSVIPVELLSGIYESFIGERQSELGAYYTPRHLANFVVDQAFLDSPNVANEIILDPACGSGILLTTAFRRLLRCVEGKQKRTLGLRERIELLEKHIFGSDISEAACRVTAFSLYLSLLEDLLPSDISELQNSEGTKLPKLRGRNLLCGDKEGDYFSKANRFASTPKFTLVISNPPWGEPDNETSSTAERWAMERRLPRVRRQVAGDFSFRAVESLAPTGRMCLILPISLLVAPTSKPFVQGWLTRVHLTRFINFGDFHNFIFRTAEHSCAVITATPRLASAVTPVPSDETIEYWAPKVDASLAFGRLTLSSLDRHVVPTHAYFSDPSRMITLAWGNEFDIALCERLRLLGTVEDMFTRAEEPWWTRKGVHLQDKHAQQSDATYLHEIPHATIDVLKEASPSITEAMLSSFPDHIRSVANLSEDLIKSFRAPRVLFSDGFDSKRQIRASYIGIEASFTSSVGAICGPHSESQLLQFLAVYLRSSLATYFLLMRAYQVSCDRNRVTLSDIRQFPFVTPNNHPNPSLANKLMKDVTSRLKTLESNDSILRVQNAYEAEAEYMDQLIYSYFGLNASEIDLVREAVSVLVPSVRPRGYRSINTALYQPVDEGTLSRYTEKLGEELQEWITYLGGKGQTSIRTWTVNSPLGRAGVTAVAMDSNGVDHIPLDETKLTRWVTKALRDLAAQGLLPAHRSESLSFLPDVSMQTSGAFILIRPMFKRMWLRRSAIQDARTIVAHIHKYATLVQ